MNKLWKDPVASAVIATLIGTFLLWLGNYIYNWIDLTKIYNTTINFLFENSVQPNWVLIILYLCTSVIILGLLFTANDLFFTKKENVLDWRTYKTDTFYDIKWRWDYRGSYINKLSAHCPHCDYQVFPISGYSSDMYPTETIEFKCDSCHSKIGPFKMTYDLFENKVERFIQQKLRNNSWNMNNDLATRNSTKE